jgi:hypothetical protein
MLPQAILKSESVDLKKYPVVDEQKHSTTLTVGDMHGNTMKLLWILIREGAINMNEKDFTEMWEIYSGMDKPTIDTLEKFNKILKNITIKNRNFSLRLIGDVFADRGRNDYLTLKTLEKLHVGGIKPEIIYSNHDAYLLNSYQKELADWEFPKKEKNKTDQKSMFGLATYIKSDQAKHIQEVRKLINNYVVPQIKLISYFLSEDKKKIDLFMHAPNNFDTVEKLTKVFNVICDISTAENFAKTIAGINNAFALYMSPSHQRTKEIDDLLHVFIWNRLKDNDGNIDFTTYPAFVSHIIHGHTHTLHCDENKQVNLDTPLGKESISEEGYDPNKENYKAFFTSEIILSAKNQYLQSWMKNTDTNRKKNIVIAKTKLENLLSSLQQLEPKRKEQLLKIIENARILLDNYIWPRTKKNPETMLNDFYKEVTRIENILKAQNWIKKIEGFASTELDHKNKEKFENIINTANKLLDGYILQKDPKILFLTFTNSIIKATELVDQRNIYKNFIDPLSEYLGIKSQKSKEPSDSSSPPILHK